MPLTLTQFLALIPLTISVLFLPFLLTAVLKRRPLKPLLIAYLITSALLVVVFFLMSLSEHLNK